MGKILITKKNYLTYHREQHKKFYLSKDMILSPSVKDILRDQGVVIVYGDRPVEEVVSSEEQPSVCENQTTAMVQLVTRLLSEDYGITDRDTICYVTKKVLEGIHKND